MLTVIDDLGEVARVREGNGAGRIVLAGGDGIWRTVQNVFKIMRPIRWKHNLQERHEIVLIKKGGKYYGS